MALSRELNQARELFGLAPNSALSASDVAKCESSATTQAEIDAAFVLRLEYEGGYSEKASK